MKFLGPPARSVPVPLLFLRVRVRYSGVARIDNPSGPQDAHPFLPRLRDRLLAGAAGSRLYREPRGSRASSPCASRARNRFAMRPGCRPRESHRPCQPRRRALPRFSRVCRSCRSDCRSCRASRRCCPTNAEPCQPSSCHPCPRSRRCARYEIGDHPRFYSARRPRPLCSAPARLSRVPDAPK